MNTELLAELLFPQITKSVEDYEAQYPPRNLPEGAKVTRFAPSPTGFVHFGGMYQVMIGERLAHQSGGVFYLRIEDTDAKREVEGAAQGVIKTLAHYGAEFDEGASIGEDGSIVSKGIYGPHKQSQRAEIYQTYAKKLVKEGKAYPVFTTAQELEEALAVDKKTENKTKDWSATAEEARKEMLANREITIEQVQAELAAGHPFVLRILSDGDGEKKVKVVDQIKGALELPENDEDFVLLKSDGIPTYHFAHAVDDHLMGTTHVIRGEEWLPSLPKHLQLFRYLGFRAPKYLHTAQVLRLDENGNKKKLSKRDMGAKMEDYDALGYPPVSVIEYLMTLLNSNYEEWHAANPALPYTEFPVTIKKLSTSGCLFDFNKLDDVSKNVISRMTAEEVYAYVLAWAKEYDAPFAETLESCKDRAIAAFAIGRGGKKPRKDFATWAEAKKFISFFFPSYYAIEDEITAFAKEDIKAALTKFEATYSEADDSAAWFDKVKAIAEELGYCSNMKEYKANPDAYPGNVGDISTFIRVALTGRTNSPDLYTVMQILGREEALSRIHSYYEGL
ncbi:MAG: glutamate--tRNA ligase [Ruminococcaceae bacterium]|nr:glutamate--tRNA ligase [Oscillospiraceae bacterium]